MHMYPRKRSALLFQTVVAVAKLGRGFKSEHQEQREWIIAGVTHASFAMQAPEGSVQLLPLVMREPGRGLQPGVPADVQVCWQAAVEYGSV